MSGSQSVHVVDHDQQLREGVRQILQDAGLQSCLYASAEDFLQTFDFDVVAPQCLIVEVRLPGLSGLGLHQKLTAEGHRVPTVILTAFGSIPMAVQAIKAGVIDFLEKPVHRSVLIDCVQQALDVHAQELLGRQHQRDLVQRLGKLSGREREVMSLLLEAKNTKEIARSLGISQQTVAKHRTAILEKLNVASVPALLRLDSGGETLRPHTRAPHGRFGMEPIPRGLSRER